MMKKILLSVVATLIFAGVASADTFTIANGQNVIGNTFILNGLTFSNFVVFNAGNVPSPQVNLVSSNVIGGRLFLTLNPNLGFVAGETTLFKDIQLSFTVAGPVNSIDLSLLGTGGVVTESACSTAFIGAVCSPGTVLGSITNNSGVALSVMNLPTNVSFVGIFKDILIQRTSTNINDAAGRAELTVVNQSFGSVSAVPEPASMVLLGTGLTGLAGFARRRRMK